MNQLKVERTELSPEQVCMACTGMSIADLVMAIIENRDGKYSKLYKEADKCTTTTECRM